MKIGLLIPSTSNGRKWENYKETYLYINTLKSFLLTYDKEHSYTFYIGIDRNDKVYDDKLNQEELTRFCSIMTNIEIEFMYMDDISKGHLTIMWNVLFNKAYNDGCDYFFQCGDDINFKTTGWINSCINALKQSNNIGVTGPLNNNARILTQSFVSRKHMELFGFYFPPEIINWFCDDWINLVYKGMNKYYPLKEHKCDNVGGTERYVINNDKFNGELDFRQKVNIMNQKCHEIVKRDLERIKGKI